MAGETAITVVGVSIGTYILAIPIEAMTLLSVVLERLVFHREEDFGLCLEARF